MRVAKENALSSPAYRLILQMCIRDRALDIVKRAVFLVFEDTELAWALLEKVRGASVREMFAAGSTGETAVRDGKRQGEKRYRLLLYVDRCV